MKHYLLKKLYPLLSYLRESLGWLIGLFQRACFWQWHRHVFIDTADHNRHIVYFGRNHKLNRAMQLLGRNDSIKPATETNVPPEESIIIRELPFSGAICAPIVLSTVVSLDQSKSFESAISLINKSRVRYYKKNRDAYLLKQVFDDADIDIASETMLKPYADSRHGDGVSHLTREDIVKIARITGALHFVYLNNELVACKVSKEVKRHGKRYWRSIRAGYPEHVFKDAHRFGEIHNMNIFLAMEWAFNEGYDYFDKSIALARPLNKVLQWKRSYRGLLSLMGNYTYFHIAPPQDQASTFFWHSPLFSKEKHQLTLHIGIPDTTSEVDALEYLSFMGFGGLSVVYLHCDSKPPAKYLAYINTLYKHFELKPEIKILINH